MVVFKLKRVENPVSLIREKEKIIFDYQTVLPHLHIPRRKPPKLLVFSAVMYRLESSLCIQLTVDGQTHGLTKNGEE